MTPQRAAKLKRAVEVGLEQWPQYRIDRRDAPPAKPRLPQSRGEVVRAMPRRRPYRTIEETAVAMPMARRVRPRAGLVRPVARLARWSLAGAQFLSGITVDWIRGHGSAERRAIRLRETFERLGGTFIKVGQQLSIRADLLPYAYCAELGKMLDRANPFPTTEAIAIIERNLGCRLDQVFEVFDPDPIGSASLACVYQAILRNGETVAVKVRRPNVDKQLAADLRVLDWVLGLAEALTIVRPRVTKPFRRELRKILFDELNFRLEARYTDMFRRRSLINKFGLTAPRIYFEYSSEEVMVGEFVSGVWMWEVIAAVDAKDHKFLAELAARGIEPKELAHRLVQAVHHELLNEMFYHADPHPANIVVAPDNKICFIDFGSVGRLSTESRQIWRELQHHMKNQDAERMVATALQLAGPLPPIDLEKVKRELQVFYADWLVANASEDAEWWERSAAQTWYRYLGVARENGLPVTLEALQFFRATLLYDSIITRLDDRFDPIGEWKFFQRDAGKKARKRVQKFWRRRLLEGPTKTDYVYVEQVADLVQQGFFRLRESIRDPIIQFRNIVGKIAYTVWLILSLVYVVVMIGGIAFVADVIAERWFSINIPWDMIIDAVTRSRYLHIAGAIVVLALVRHIIIRAQEPDKRPPSRD